MIQFAELGRVFADPLKSSVHTDVQPDGGGGAEALALVVTTAVPISTRADDPARMARRALRLIRGAFGGDIAGVPSVWRVGRSDPQPAGGPATGRERFPWRAVGPGQRAESALSDRSFTAGSSDVNAWAGVTDGVAAHRRETGRG